jgi:tRNA (guanine37-N1)-methyltransferase
MKISIVTLFPQMFEGPFKESIIKRAAQKGIVEIEYIDIRTFGIGTHKIVDDKPYGGGAGMLLRVDVLKNALDSAKCQKGKSKCSERSILLDPKGTLFSQKKARELTCFDHLILVCAHYEGVDERFKKYIDEEISIGDYIVTGGEIPAMVLTDSVLRLIPGVLGKEESNQKESFENLTDEAILEYPQYTRPDEFEGEKVPEVLKAGNHKKIVDWKRKESIKVTRARRSDLI